MMGGNEALRVAMAEAARERVGHKLEVEAEEASVIELEDSIQKTIKEELHTLSPEVSTSRPWIDMYKFIFKLMRLVILLSALLLPE